MYALSFGEALLKYSPDQEREPAGSPEGGRWSGGDGGKGGSKSKVAAEYKRRFGHVPPASMSRAAMRRWIDSEYRTAPGKGKDKATRAIWAEEQSARAKGYETARRERYERERAERQAVIGAEDALKAAEAAMKGGKTPENMNKAGNHVIDAYDKIRSLPDGVWYEPTTADRIMGFLTSFDTTMSAALLGVAAASGAGIVIVGTYLMMRYVYRKVVTAGAYRGVRWSLDRDRGR